MLLNQQGRGRDLGVPIAIASSICPDYGNGGWKRTQGFSHARKRAYSE